ncbi:MAG: GatB/YqeY domain-containing protein [bacterium]|nr:GatB/YqeY domain-containing protein [bacterium]
MNLKEQIQGEFIKAFKARDEIRSSVLKMLQAGIKNAEIEKRKELDDDEIIGVISKEAKKRKDAMEAFEKGGRAEMAENEKKEFEILSAYLSEQMPEEEIKKLVGDAIRQSGASDPKNIGKVMAILSPQTKGRADGALVSKIVRESLASA